MNILSGKNIQVVLSFFLFIAGYASASEKEKQSYDISSSGFVENKGQIVDAGLQPNLAVKYLMNTPGLNVQLRQNGFSYDTYRDESASGIRHYHRIDIELKNCNQHPQIITEGKSIAYYNYFTSGATAGITDVHSYKKVIYKNIYKHIDLEFKANSLSSGDAFEYDFVVHPGGKASDIQLDYQGANDISLRDGRLSIEVEAGIFTENIPSSYFKNTREEVKVTYSHMENNLYSFNVPYNLSQTDDLVIDPSPNLFWSTFYGYVSQTVIDAIDLGSDNSVYVTGNTADNTGIATSGAFQTTYNTFTVGQAAFVGKFSPNGSTLLWATYYSGQSGISSGHDLAVAAGDNVFVVGETSGTGMATAGSFQTIYGGGSSNVGDVFVAEFSANGQNLLWATYYGKGADERSYGIQLDAGNMVYITGWTNSTGMATAGAYQTARSGATIDAFIAKFDPSASGSAQLVWSTYYGKAGTDVPDDLAIDASGYAYITGNTTSNGMATSGAYQTNRLGGASQSVFIAKFDPALSGSAQLIWATYYGGGGLGDSGGGIVADAGNIYVSGYTRSTNMAKAGAYKTTFSGGGNYDAFVAKFDPSATGSGQFVWGTYYGGAPDDLAHAITLDADRNVYVAGWTATSGIATNGAYQTAPQGTDAFIAKLDPSGSSLLWASYFGGADGLAGGDGASAITLDPYSNIYITGTAGSIDIATPGAYQTKNEASQWGSVIGFVAKFNQCTLTANPPTTICTGSNTTLTVSGGNIYNWSPSSTLSSPTGASVVAHPTSSFTTYTITDATCNGFTIVNLSTTTPVLAVTPPQTICQGINQQLSLTGASTYAWTPSVVFISTNGDNVLASPAMTTTYTVVGTDGLGCTSSVTTALTVNQLPVINPSPGLTMCIGGLATTLSAAQGLSYIWRSTTGLHTTTGAVVSFIPTLAGSHNITITGSDVNCSKDTMISVTINPLPIIAIDPPGTTICSGGIAPLSASGAMIYNWSPATMPSTGPQVTVSASANYTVTGTDANQCTSTATALVVVLTNPTITVFPGNSLSICMGDETTITASGTSLYTWNPNTALTNANSAIVTANPIDNITYSVTGTDNIGCGTETTVLVSITVNALPTLSAAANDLSICPGGTTILSATGAVNYTWSPVTTPANGPQVNAIAFTPGAITYTVTGTDNNLCSNHAEVTIVVNTPQPVTVSASMTISEGSSTSISASGGISYVWAPVTDLICSTCQSITVTPITETTYTVTMTDANGCTSEGYVTITVLIICGEGSFIPNAFSPNADNENDVLYFYGTDLRCFNKYKLSIYDRWGNMLFETTDQSEGWDGKHNGKELPAGVFVYRLEYSYLGETHSKKGNVSLIR